MTGSARTDDPPVLSPAEFARIAALAHREAGLCLSQAKHALISSRLARRLRATGLQDFAAYLALLEGREGAAERRMLISALTTNVSHFFREAHHFETLARELLPGLVARARRGERVRIWSAGCAAGQEPYSIAMTVLRAFPQAAETDLRILATDIDETVLAAAAAGRYPARQADEIAEADRRRFFRPHADGVVEVSDEMRALVTFRPLNLVGAWPMRGPFDAIFCRNVVIYFDAATQAALWPRFDAVLAPEGFLFIGHSERLDPASAARFRSVGVTSYRKSASPAAVSGKGDASWP